jgi:hypothetical protein
MSRPTLAALALAALSTGGEPVEAVYREGGVLVCATSQSTEMELDEASITLNGMELPPEALDELGPVFPTQSSQEEYRIRDEILAVADGRPERVRRTFELLHKAEVEDGEETEKTGPLEGLSLLLTLEDGEPAVELEAEDEDIEERYLEHHRLEHDTDLLLPDEPVEVGDSWAAPDELLRRFLDLADEPLLFEPDEDDDDAFEEMIRENSTYHGEVELLELTERDGLRCAVLAFRFELEAVVDDLSTLGMEAQEGMGEPSGRVTIQLESHGKLWHAIEEGRPVALEQTMEGSAAMRFEANVQAEGHEFLMKAEIDAAIEGEALSVWSRPE